ncbi:acyl carrier protein [Streptomyces microflavus]|jgi:act minimal PKS acyl carrier protein|uniref:Actinorhodin polyketide synthase n=2 Tax=Streptomyces microflavus TaxID=1919 RepID=A0A7H8MQM4_STRMI|nr:MULTISPECIES: acyl carrier protein [Streptomyces]AGK78906.1 actinorhodin polyketide synthase acyl carrier protein [Streptomyces microflavus DSM 40593]MBK5996341.1 acyl carrier protein [Streptomyces sp. MBT58]MCX4654023.1 acyl carrier protein [Streptomyces microflavus]MDX2407176.1 acyl carrier protein [Streptomyces microflavus]MDX2980856.1 acyl carrier protein [Streptomyces sp. NRRL_B-2249]
MDNNQTFTLESLKRILREGAGADESVDFDGDILDADFEELGYESLAILETCGRIEREYGITLDDSVVSDVRTPRRMVEVVNEHLGQTAPA